MKRKMLAAATALALYGTAQGQTNEQLKTLLDQALKTIDDLKGRVQALEADKHKAGTAAPAAASTVNKSSSSTNRSRTRTMIAR